MKQIILIITLVLFSCSKNDDNGPRNLELTRQNISGVWFPSQVVKSNGALENVNRLCETIRDTIKIEQYGLISSKVYFNCDYYDEWFYCNYFYFLENNRISSCEAIFDGHVTELTDQKMRIDYDEPLNELSTHNMNDMKALILTRN